MLRLLGFVFVVILGIATAPWGLLVGAVALVGWLSVNSEPLSKLARMQDSEDQLGSTAGGMNLNAVPLMKAVYCANCDLITDSTHDACGVCRSHSVISVSRMWQLTPGCTPSKTARFRVSLTAMIRDIPVTGLNESTKLISRLVELGGHIDTVHIQIEPACNADDLPDVTNVEVMKPMERNTAWDQVRRAS
jgi:hypothetical protein